MYLSDSFVWNGQGTAYVMQVGYDAWAVVDAASETIIGQRSMRGWPISQKPVWSPNGTRLTYIHDDRVWLWTIGGDGEQGHTAQ